jgi:hypothetical protein
LEAPDGTQGDEAQVEARFYPFGDNVSVSARLVHGCAKSTIGSKIVLDAPMVLLDDDAQVEAHFGPFGDSGTLDAR